MNGVKDSLSWPIVQALLDMGKQLRKPVAGKPKMPEHEVQKQLGDKLESLLRRHSIEDFINPLLGMPGMNHNSISVVSSHINSL